MQAIADQVIEVMAIEALLDRLLAPPALPVGLGEPLGTGRAEAGDVDPGPPFVGGRTSTQGKEAQTVIPGTDTEAHRSPILQPAPLLRREGCQAGTDGL